MKNLFFAVFYSNSQTGINKVINIHDDVSLADAECQALTKEVCKRPSSCISFCVIPCSYNTTKRLADDVLISIVNYVAQDLLIAERGFKKGIFKKETFEKSSRWFGLAYAACRRGASILDVLNY